MFSIQSHSFIDTLLHQVMSVHSTRCPRPRRACPMVVPFLLLSLDSSVNSTLGQDIKIITATNNNKNLLWAKGSMFCFLFSYFFFIFLVERVDIRVGPRASHVLNTQRCLPNYSTTSKRLCVFHKKG